MRPNVPAIEIDDAVADVLRINAHGELADAREAELADHLGDAARGPARDIVVDLSDVSYVSARALRQLVTARRQLATRGRRLVIVAPEGPVARAAQLAGPGALAVYPSERDALNGLTRPSGPDA